jgi:hypothetical protein
MRWAVEATAFGRVRHGQIRWTANAGHAREHLLALVRWLPTAVRTATSTEHGERWPARCPGWRSSARTSSSPEGLSSRPVTAAPRYAVWAAGCSGGRAGSWRGPGATRPTGCGSIVDPIDGTTSYLYGRADWSVSLAATRAADDQLLAGVVLEPALGRMTQARIGSRTSTAGEPVRPLAQQDLSRALVEVNLGRAEQRARAGRMVDSLLPCVRDLRRSGSAAAALAAVATGRADAAWLPGLQPWGCAAGVLLVQQAGGVVGDLTGQTPGPAGRTIRV